jgi:TolA-binding protein
LAALQATTNGELSTMNGQIVQMQALLGQTTKNLQLTREQLNAIREQSPMPPTPSPVGATSRPGDVSSRVPAGLPGSATLLLTGKEALDKSAYSTSRMSFDQLLSAYPNSVEAPSAQFLIGQSYTSEGNTAAADSVYVVLYTKYPKSPYASTGLYRHGTYLWDQGKKPEARIALTRVLTEYPTSDEVGLVRNFLKDRDK